MGFLPGPYLALITLGEGQTRGGRTRICKLINTSSQVPLLLAIVGVRMGSVGLGEPIETEATTLRQTEIQVVGLLKSDFFSLQSLLNPAKSVHNVVTSIRSNEFYKLLFSVSVLHESCRKVM